MKHAETVTFGGDGLDRAAELRSDPALLAELRAAPQTRAVLFWRSKPLFCGDQQQCLARLSMDHPVVRRSKVAPVLLGRDGGAAVFAVDVSDWQPDEVDEMALGAFLDPTVQQHPDLPPDHQFCELRAVMARIDALDAELAATGKAILSWQRSHRFCAKCGAESRMAQAGWQRDCPVCGAHHFPRTDPVVIMLITRGNRVLMGRSHGWPDGVYSLLAGFLEPGETLEAAVRREVAEEAGIRVGDVSYLASQPWPYPSSLMVGCWGVALDDEIVIDPKELDDAIWVTREEMMAAFAGDHAFLKPARKGSIAQFILNNWLADTLD